MNDYFNSPSRGGFDAAYYWEQFHPILAAVAILIVGWIVALIIAAGIKKLLNKLNTNQHLSTAMAVVVFLTAESSDAVAVFESLVDVGID